MESVYKKENKQLIFKLEQDIDECAVQKIRRKLDNEIERFMPKEVIFDFNNVSFMDSAGIGLIIGRYKLASMLGGKVQVTNGNICKKNIWNEWNAKNYSRNKKRKKGPGPKFRKKRPGPFFKF